YVVAAAREVVEERVPDRGATVPLLQQPARRAVLRVVSDRALPLPPERELERAELEGLEPAAGLEAVAEREELERRHGLEHVDLRDQHLEDGEHALERVQGARGVIGREQVLEVIQLVQDLPEPQLVDLVDDDEEHLVV